MYASPAARLSLDAPAVSKPRIAPFRSLTRLSLDAPAVGKPRIAPSGR